MIDPTPNTNTTVAVPKAAAEPFAISEMSNLRLQYLLFCRYNHELNCDAAWTVNTGKSSSQDRSRITSTIIPLMLKTCDPNDLTILETPKPDSRSAAYEVWRAELLRISAKVENQVRLNLEADEKEFLPPRNESRKRDMCINGVMDRLKKVNNAKKARLAAAHPSVKSHFGFTSVPGAAMSSSLASDSTTGASIVALSYAKPKAKKQSNKKKSCS